eukprot:Lithocolla_globosa_v1_NODE_479_length_3945_cov_27.737018.p6 type:complete len:102 gc:universal NODE_479_length_3945_cov_27.737018:3020-2715(-)
MVIFRGFELVVKLYGSVLKREVSFGVIVVTVCVITVCVVDNVCFVISVRICVSVVTLPHLFLEVFVDDFVVTGGSGGRLSVGRVSGMCVCAELSNKYAVFE